MKPPTRYRPARSIRRCRDVIELLSEYMEGGLPPADVRRIEAHFAGCPPCVEFLETLRKTRTAVRSLAARDVPEECRRSLRVFLKKNLKPRR
jgi:anti-sigma factor (TIGR02949 family)